MVGSGGRGVLLLLGLLTGCLWRNPAFEGADASGPPAGASDPSSDASMSEGTGAPTGSATGESASGTSGTDGGSSASGTGGSGCAASDPCDADAECLDQEGSIVCTCRPGFLGDGYSCAPAPTLAPLHWELPCTPDDCSSRACVTGQMAASDAQPLVGEAGVTYDVTLWIRGVVEEKEYLGGAEDGHWSEGGTPNGDNFNQMALEVSDPPQKYWINSGGADVSHCVALDDTRTLPIKAGAMVTLSVVDPNACQIFNQDGPGGVPLQIPDIPTVTQPFDGQFVYVEVVGVAVN